MSVAVALGAKSLINFGASYGDIAALVQHGRLVANWLQTRQVDAELFESISEVFGEVLRRRGLVDSVLMDNRWSSQWHFIHKGKMVHHADMDKVSKDGELPAFSWLMVSLVAAMDVCLTSSEIRKFLAQVFVRILDRDDVSDLSEAINLQLHTNVESWRSSGCIRGLVVPVQSAMRSCYLRLTGSKSIPQLTPAEMRELSDLLVWLLAGRTSKHHVLSAVSFSVFAGLRSVGIQVDVVDEYSGSDICGERPVVHYSSNSELETGLNNILELNFLAAGFSTQIPPQKSTFVAGNPAEMIEGFRRPNKIKNRMALCWDKGAAAGRKIRLSCQPGRDSTNALVYGIESSDESHSRWPKEVCYLAEHACPISTQTLCTAIDDLFGDDVGSLYTWLLSNVDGTEPEEGEPDDMVCQSKVMDASRSFPAEELDRFLAYQALVYGFWYAMLDQLISTEYIKQDVYLSTLWGWRDHRLLTALETNAGSMRHFGGIRGGLHRGHLLQLLGLMFAARRETETPPSRDLVGIIGPVSVVSMSLLKTSDEPEIVAKYAIVSLPILDLLPDYGGELYAIDPQHGLHYERPTSPCEVAPMPPVRCWSIHTQMKLEEGEIHGVVMVARCDGRLIATFSPARADSAVVASWVRKKSEDVGNDTSQSSVSATTASIRAYEIKEELLLQGAMLSWSAYGVPFVIQSRGNVSMRYFAAGLCGPYQTVMLANNETLPWALKLIKAKPTDNYSIIC